MPDTKYLYKRGPIWWFQKRHKTQILRHSLETDDLRQAQKRRDRILEEIAAGQWGESRPRTFNEAAERWIDEHIPTLKPKSRTRYRVSLEKLLEIFDGVPINTISSKILSEFEQARRADGVTPTTIRRDLACLSSLLSSAEEWEWLDGNPVKAYVRGRAKKGLVEGAPKTRYLSIEEEARLLNPKHVAPKAAQAIAFAIDTGLRKEEQFSLLRSDVDTTKWTITVRAAVAKSGRSRTIPLFERSRELVAMILEMPSESPYLFTTSAGERYSANSPTMYEALQKAVRNAGLAERVAWHDLRRTCGCRLLNEYGYSMHEVSAWLGHSSVQVTERHYAFLQFDRLSARRDARESKVAASIRSVDTQFVTHEASRNEKD